VQPQEPTTAGNYPPVGDRYVFYSLTFNLEIHPPCHSTGISVYSQEYKVGYCSGSNGSCLVTENLLSKPSREPLTLDGCSDGPNDSSRPEMVKWFKVLSVDGGDLRGGRPIRIRAAVVPFSKFDRVDFYITGDPNSANVKWQFITTATPVETSGEVIATNYSPDPYITAILVSVLDYACLSRTLL